MGHGRRLPFVSSTLEERIRSIVHEQHRDQLAELVRQVIDRELQQLVDVELEQRTNGQPKRQPLPVRLCELCGERDAERHRRVCGRCRRARRAPATPAAAGDVP